MPRMSPGLAKNHIRRALRAIVDPEPKVREIFELWDYFESCCAYCGVPLDRRMRNGHIDHLVHDGSNHISNRVLACPTCNGDEKREGPWLGFLCKKTQAPALYKIRKNRIESWVKRKFLDSSCYYDKQRLEDEIKPVVAAFNLAVTRLRQAKERESKAI